MFLLIFLVLVYVIILRMYMVGYIKRESIDC